MQFSTMIAVFGLIGLATAATIPPTAWEEFKEVHGKSYSTPEEESLRRSLFEKNVARIQEHNGRFLSGLETFSVEVNQFTDMTTNEIVGNGFIFEEMNETVTHKHFQMKDLPNEIDWRIDNEGSVSKVKAQGPCGSCWAFSTTGSLEGQVKIKKNKVVSLSESQLVHCDTESHGCHGGLMVKAFNYLKKQGGIMSEEDYPYEPEDYEDCNYDASKAVPEARVSGYVKMTPGDEEQLLHAIAEVGPISVAVDVTWNFHQYRGGIFDDPTCKSGREDLHHAVLAVGYNLQEGYIIVKNSWGPYWGEQGYIRFAARKNMCGIAVYTIYPTLE